MEAEGRIAGGCGGDSEGTTFYRRSDTSRGGEKPQEAVEKARGNANGGNA
jgi:hypothetical protein